MLLDVIQYFGDDLTERQREGCPVSFTEVIGIRNLRVVPEGEGKGYLVIIDSLHYEFAEKARAIAAARRLADLQSEAVEQYNEERAQVHAVKGGEQMKEVIKPLLEQEQGR